MRRTGSRVPTFRPDPAFRRALRANTHARDPLSRRGALLPRTLQNDSEGRPAHGLFDGRTGERDLIHVFSKKQPDPERISQATPQIDRNLPVPVDLGAEKNHAVLMKLCHLSDLPIEGVSHNPEIKKRVFLRNGEVPGLTQFAQSTTPPGSVAPAHSHPDMTEVFVVVSGVLTACIDASTGTYPAGSCLVIEPGESHEIRNDGPEDLVLSYFGILT